MQHLYKRPNHNTSLYNMKLKGELCDVTIKVNGKSFRAHKVVLAAGLSYFYSMFLHSFREKDQDVIYIKNIEETNLEALLGFAYTGEILITESNAFSLLEDANYLNEVDIKEACIKFLESHLQGHSSVKKAGWIWQFASAIECASLETIAKEKILSHFDTFSQTYDYLKFDLEALKILLSDDRLHSVQLQKILFEGIMRWVMYDAENRRIYLRHLLDFIKPTNVKAEYVMSYLCDIVADQDYENIEKIVMSFYRSKTNQKIGLRTQSMGLSLIVVNRSGNDIELQFYDFFKRKWSEVYKIAIKVEYFEAHCIILNNQLYLVKSTEYDAQLEIINFKIKQCKTIMEKIPRASAICIHDRYLYLCGGFKTTSCGNNEYSNEIYEYDPETDFMATLAPMKYQRSYAATIFHQDCLYVLGGCRTRFAGEDRQGAVHINLVEKYDLDTKEWSDVAPMREARLSFEVAVLNGKLYACGGPDSCSAEVYDPLKNNWQTISDMKKKRWDFVLVALEGKLLAIGGDEELTVEIYYPQTDKWVLDPELSLGLQLRKPTGGFIQSSGILDKNSEHIFNQSNM